MLGNSSGQDPNDHRWIYTYDASTSHLVSAIDPDGRVVVTNTYADAGRLTSQVDGLGKETTFDYPSGQTEIPTRVRTRPIARSFAVTGGSGTRSFCGFAMAKDDAVARP